MADETDETQVGRDDEVVREATGAQPGSAASVRPRRATPPSSGLPKIGCGLMSTLGALGLAGLLLLTSVYRQDVGESMVVLTPGGQIKAVDTTPGFGFKMPWDGLRSFETRNRVMTMSGDGAGAEAGAIRATTSDNAVAYLDLAVRYSIRPDRVGEIYREYRSGEVLQDAVLEKGLRSIARDIPVRYEAGQLRQQREKVSAEIFAALEKDWDRFGVELVDVDLRDIRFDDDVEKSLSQIQVARSKVEAARAELETAKIDAEKTKTRARADSDADQILRCGAQVSTTEVEIGGKKQEITEIVPVKGDKCENRLNEQVLTARYIDMLREAAANGSAVYVVPSEGAGQLLQLPAPAKTEKK